MKLKEVLTNAKIIAMKKTSVPVLGMIIITVKDSHATAQSCDLNAYYQGSFVIKDVKDGTYSIDQKGVNAFLAGMKIENVLIKFDRDEMPEYPEMKVEDIKYESVNDEFIDALVKSCTVAKIEDARTWTNGVYLETGNIVSTNGRQLMLFEDAHGTESALIPALYLQHLAKFKFIEDAVLGVAPSGNAIAGIGKSDDKKYFVIKNDEQQLAIELIDAKFPDWDRVIPKDYNLKITVERKPLIKALKRLEQIFRPYRDGAEWREDIMLTASKNVLELNITTASDISESVMVDCISELDEFKILVNINYLLSAANNATEDTIEIYHEKPERDYGQDEHSLRPILIETSGYKHVIMPIRERR